MDTSASGSVRTAGSQFLLPGHLSTCCIFLQFDRCCYLYILMHCTITLCIFHMLFFWDILLVRIRFSDSPQVNFFTSPGSRGIGGTVGEGATESTELWYPYVSIFLPSHGEPRSHEFPTSSLAGLASLFM